MHALLCDICANVTLNSALCVEEEKKRKKKKLCRVETCLLCSAWLFQDDSRCGAYHFGYLPLSCLNWQILNDIL